MMLVLQPALMPDSWLWQLRSHLVRALSTGSMAPGHPAFLQALDTLDAVESELERRGFTFERTKTA